MHKIIQFPSANSQRVAQSARTVNQLPAQVIEPPQWIRRAYRPMLPAVEVNIVRDWRRGVSIRLIASMYRGRGVCVAQIEAIIWRAVNIDWKQAA